VQISLDVRNENLSEKCIHQICACCRSGERARASQLETAAGTSSCCRSPFPAILTVVALLFSSPHGRRQPRSRVPGHDPRLQKEPKVLKTRQEVDWAAMPSCVPTSKAPTDGDGSRCFPLVIYNAGCIGSGLQLQPRVEREDDRRPRAAAQADVSSSFRFAALGMTRHIPYRIERELAFLRLR
jgi:hypothetical protein